MLITIIAAMSKNRVIGKDNKIPWHISEDFKYFKEKTMGKPVVMGRKTYESMGKLLPGRTNIVVARKEENCVIDGAVVVNSMEEAWEQCALLFGSAETNDEVMVIGGGEIYKQTLQHADTIFLTIVDVEIEGDTYFPELGDEWENIKTTFNDGDPSFSFNTFLKMR